MRKHFRIAALALLGLAAVTTAQAQFPRTISYQGIVADATGTPLTGNHQMTLSLYTTPTGGTPVYSETHSNVTLVRGLYNITIGSVTPIPATLSFNQAYYLGVTLDGGTELPQRTALTAVPYALYADTANSAKTATRATSAASADDLAPTASVVRSLNGQAGQLEIVGGGSTTVTRTGNTITIFSRDTSGTGNVSPITSVQPLDRSITVQNFFGPNVGIKIRENGVNTEQLADNAVITPKIIDEAITTAKLANFSVTTSKLVDGAVTTSKIANLAITNALLAANAVTTDKIMDGTIQTVDLADGSVTNPKLAPNAVTTDKIFDGTIQTVDLADGSVTNPKLAANAVTTDKIMDGQVQTADILNLNVTNAKLAADAVTTDKIQDGQVQTGDIANLNVTNGKLAADAVTTDKIQDGQVQTGDIANLNVTTAKIADGSVTTPKLADGAVTNPKLGADAVTTDKILDLTIGTNDLANNAVTNVKVNATGSTNGQALMSNGTATPVWGNPFPAGPAGGDLTGNYPNPTIAATAGNNIVAAINNAATTSAIMYARLALTNSIVTADLTNNAVTTAKLADGSVTNAKLGANAVDAAKISTAGATTNGQALIFNGSTTPVWGSPIASGITLPYSASVNSASTLWDLTNTGTGGGGSYSVNNAGSSAAALSATTNGTGNAASFTNTNAGSVNNTVFITNNGAGSSISAANTGTGRAGNFVTNNAGNTATTINAFTNGLGSAGGFQISNGGSVANVVGVTTNGIGNGISISLTNASNGGRGIDVAQSGVGPGVFATSAGGNAVWGITSSISAAGVIGDNTFGEAVVGRNRGGNGVGAVVGRNDSSGYGVRGFNTKNGIGVIGQAGISGGTGVAGRFENVNAANTSPALVAVTNSSGPALTTTGRAEINNGNLLLMNSNGTAGEVRFYEPSASGSEYTAFRAQGQASNVTYLLPTDDGSVGQALTTDGSGGLYWSSVGLVLPYSATANAASPLLSITQTGASNVGSFVINNGGSVATVLNLNHNGIGNGLAIQLSNSSNGGRGIDVAQSGVGPGVFATSAGGNAVWGITSSISAAGVIGDNTFGEAVVGRNRGGNGVGAVVGRNDSSGYGVRGFNTKNGYGVLGQAGISGGTGTAGRFENVNAANTSDALQVVTNSAGNSARFTGNVVINGNLTVSGTVAKGGGTFKIDHPLDPQNKYLYHSFVESPEMLNIYNGTIKLDGNGEAVVEMPEWFQAVNGDYRYQLTPIGAPGPNLYIAEEITDNRFKIAGGTPGMKVSWMVTGIRHDRFSQKHRTPVEEEKAPEDRGRYLHPDVYDQPMEMQIGRLPIEQVPSAAVPSAAPVDPNAAKRTPNAEDQTATPIGR